MTDTSTSRRPRLSVGALVVIAAFVALTAWLLVDKATAGDQPGVEIGTARVCVRDETGITCWEAGGPVPARHPRVPAGALPAHG